MHLMVAAVIRGRVSRQHGRITPLSLALLQKYLTNLVKCIATEGSSFFKDIDSYVYADKMSEQCFVQMKLGFTPELVDVPYLISSVMKYQAVILTHECKTVRLCLKSTDHAVNYKDLMALVQLTQRAGPSVRLIVCKRVRLESLLPTLIVPNEGSRVNRGELQVGEGGGII